MKPINKNILLIASRYLFSKQQENSISSMIKICFLGITIATCSLALVVSVMSGFEKTTHEKMQSIYPDLILDTNGKSINMSLLDPILKSPQYSIQAYAPEQTGQALLYNDSIDPDSQPILVCLKGINPDKTTHVTNFSSKITSPTSTTIEQMLVDNKIIIGHKLAQQLQVSVHDEIIILFTEDEPESLQVNFQKRIATIGAIFKTGVEEFDNNLAYSNSLFFNQLFPDQGITQVAIKLHDASHDTKTAKLLSDRLKIDVYSWKQLYPALVSALKLEKYAMFFILLLIVCIASMNIISLIFMYITQKKRDIAILSCFGMKQKDIQKIFIYMSLFISFFATIVGLLSAYIIGKLLQVYPFIKLPDDAYYSSYLPISLDKYTFIIIFISSITISFIASLISTKKIKYLTIAQILKEE